MVCDDNGRYRADVESKEHATYCRDDRKEVGVVPRMVFVLSIKSVGLARYSYHSSVGILTPLER